MTAARLLPPGVVCLMLSTLGLPVGGGRCFADRIALRGGGQIRGKVVADPRHPDRVTVLTETGKTPLTFQKAQVLQVVAEPSVLDEYVVRRGQAAVSAGAQAQYDLGLWCEEHKLSDLAEVHYEAAVEQDKSFAPAHRKLGHVLYEARWLGGDELREAQGLVRYKGKWITKEERDQREARAAADIERASWTRRIRGLRQTIATGQEDRATAAEQQLLAIRDPIAVAPLVRVLGQDVVSLRMLLDQVLGLIPGPEAASALVGRVLAESDSEVRQAALGELERRGDENVVPGFLKALRSSHPEVVNRAAWALADLGVVAAVPRLIPALVTTQYRVVMDNSGGGQASGGLGSVSPIGVPVYANGSSLGLLTPPVVGPGSVAYGATAVPYLPYSSGSLSAGGTVSGTRGPVPKLMTFSYQNVEVLAALVKLTGRNFGYDMPSWKRWVSTAYRPDPSPARRVPQP